MRARHFVVGVLAVTAACAGAPTFDQPTLESRVATRLGRATGVEVGSVECPSGVEVEAGARFRCRATVGDGLTVEVRAEQGTERGALSIRPEQAVLSRSRVEDDATAALAERFSRPDVAVTCAGAAVRVEPVGATFTCRAVDGDEDRAVTVTVRDTAGGLAYRVEDP